MSRLENLNEVADRNLGGLKADARLLHQILNAESKKPERKVKWRPILVAGAAAVVLLAAGLIGLPQLLRYNGDISVVSRSAGGDNAPQMMSLTANVPSGSVNITESASGTQGYSNLFEEGQNANFPLIKIGEKTYRMLTSSVTAGTGQLGDSLGMVSDYTSEPALSSGGIVSNTVTLGQAVYAVKGMNAALIAADVQGTLRVFQRVSYAGTAITGGESLKDVLTGSAGVTAIELSGVGRVTGAGVQTLMNTLYQYAQYEGAAESRNGAQSLLLTLDNGLTVQMNVENGILSACGSWSCPEFFEEFEDAADN